jgi:hypothetical protein
MKTSINDINQFEQWFDKNQRRIDRLFSVKHPKSFQTLNNARSIHKVGSILVFMSLFLYYLKQILNQYGNFFYYAFLVIILALIVMLIAYTFFRWIDFMYLKTLHRLYNLNKFMFGEYKNIQSFMEQREVRSNNSSFVLNYDQWKIVHYPSLLRQFKNKYHSIFVYPIFYLFISLPLLLLIFSQLFNSSVPLDGGYIFISVVYFIFYIITILSINQVTNSAFLAFSERLEVAIDEYKLLKEFDAYNR